MILLRNITIAACVVTALQGTHTGVATAQISAADTDVDHTPTSVIFKIAGSPELRDLRGALRRLQRRVQRQLCGREVLLPGVVLMSIYPERIGIGPADQDPMIGLGMAGRYRILHRLGVGGMGVVYCARQVGMDRDVAIKIMLPKMAADAVEVQRFLSEARIAGGLGHPHIVEVFDMGKLEDGRPYLVMEYVEGEHLTDYCERRQLPIAARLRLLRAACDAVLKAEPDNLTALFLRGLASELVGDDPAALADFDAAAVLRLLVIGEGATRHGQRYRATQHHTLECLHCFLPEMP